MPALPFEFKVLLRRLSYSGSELSWVDDSSSAGHVEVAGVSGRWPGSDVGAGVGGFWDAWRSQQDLPQVLPHLPPAQPDCFDKAVPAVPQPVSEQVCSFSVSTGQAPRHGGQGA